MFDHVGVAVSDLAASERFYRTVLSVLGLEPSHAVSELVEWDDWDAIAPGPILTEGGIGAAPTEIQQRVASTVPLKRLGTPEEIAELAAWLLSDAASFVNGAAISIDGGKLAGMA